MFGLTKGEICEMFFGIVAVFTFIAGMGSFLFILK